MSFSAKTQPMMIKIVYKKGLIQKSWNSNVLRALNLLYNMPPERVLSLKQKGRLAKFWSRSQIVCSGEVDWVQYIREEVTWSKLFFLTERFIGNGIYLTFASL